MITKYNEFDVIALAVHLRPTFGPRERALEDGAQVRADEIWGRYHVSEILLYVFMGTGD